MLRFQQAEASNLTYCSALKVLDHDGKNGRGGKEANQKPDTIHQCATEGAKE